MKKLSTQSYKGTRDFYPDDMRTQNYILGTMRKVAERYGYQEYAASILEETALYRAKTGEEIVNEQTYSFTDRGGRDVTLRPEMTPTVARMVANKRRELSFPVRWYSIPNCFRYERPQRGRSREFWQLNVDLLGLEGVFADLEIIKMSYDIMRAFGADPKTFIIKVNSRKLMGDLFERILNLDEKKSYRLSKLIDKKDKMTVERFEQDAKAVVGMKFGILDAFLNARTVADLPGEMKNLDSVKEIIGTMNALKDQGVTNAVFDPALMRGFDYYTGMIFEIYDTNPVNGRSLFGGGRYDNLVDLFGVESVPAVGFGMGDLPMEGYLETYGLLPKIESSVVLTICTVDEKAVPEALKLAAQLRENISAVVDFTNRKMALKIKSAEREGSKYVLCIGETELASGKYGIKKLSDFSETEYSFDDLVSLRWMI